MALGEDLDWSGPLELTSAFVELPFWLMVEPCSVTVEAGGLSVPIDICRPRFEVFLGEFNDSRRTCIYQGPVEERPWSPTPDVAELMNDRGLVAIERDCRTVLRVSGMALADAFRNIDALEPGWEATSVQAYWASFCEGYLPAINELIQRYRLTTYDFFAQEVSAWDVPVWQVKQQGSIIRVILVPYKDWDRKPVTVESGDDPAQQLVRPFVFTDGDALDRSSTDDATPGEFELLDARSLMERGDYSGAVRRTTTAIEAVVEWALGLELGKSFPPTDVEERLQKSANDFPGRWRQLRKLLADPIPDALVDTFDRTRLTRHDIVHKGYRLSHHERGQAQMMVDQGRWLFNHIEQRPDRATIRDTGVLKSVGRTALAVRFPTHLTADGVCVDRVAVEADG